MPNSIYYQKNKEALKQKSREYYTNNKEHIKEYNQTPEVKERARQNYWKHIDKRKIYHRSDKIKERNERYRNSEKGKLEHKEYVKKNKVRIRECYKQWEKNNIEKVHNYRINRLQKEGKSFEKGVYEFAWALDSWSKSVKNRSDFKCEVCNNKTDVSHHILHKAKYPKMALILNNGISLCTPCHREVHGWNLDKSFIFNSSTSTWTQF